MSEQAEKFLFYLKILLSGGGLELSMVTSFYVSNGKYHPILISL